MSRQARSGGLWTILEREDRGRASRGCCTGRIACFLIGTRRRYLSLLSGSRGRAERGCGSIYRLGFFFKTNNVLVGNFPPEIPLQAALFEALLKKDPPP